MARGGRSGEAPGNHLAWMVTFSDLITLLLTFFVLIICITTLEPRVLQEDLGPDPQDGGRGVLGHGQGRPASPLDQIMDGLNPDETEPLPEDLKYALFRLPSPKPDSPLSPEDGGEREVTAALGRQLDQVLLDADRRGLVLKWDGAVLFSEGGADLRPEPEALLARLAEVLGQTNLGVSIEAHTDPDSALEGGLSPEAFELSFQRARTVLDFLAARGLNPARCRLGGYGPSQPRSLGRELAAGPAAEKRRVEIILYKPGSTTN